MRRHAAAVVWLLCGALAAPACLRPGESRAERDREVGHANRNGLSVDVAGGLAAIRGLEPGELHLWASAPSLELTLERDTDSVERWTLIIDNCMPDAQLRAPPGLHVAEAGAVEPTRCGWTFRLPASEAVTFSIRSPRADQVGPFRFGVLSDVQRALDQVHEVYARMNQDEQLAFVVSTGDLAENGSPERLEFFQSELLALRVPFFTTLGNHELGTSPCRFQDYFGRGSLHFEFRDVHFTLLDSASASLDPIVYDWLDDWLEQGRRDGHVVAMHIPPIDPVGTRNGGFASRNEAALLLGQLAEFGVDLTLYGHIHSYYHFENAGIDAHVSGGGGALPEQFDGIGRHYLAIDADPSDQSFAVTVVRVD